MPNCCAPARSPASSALMIGCSPSSGRAATASPRRAKTKSAWMYVGRSHHSVPSLSKTATRSAGGTKSAPPSSVTRSTNPTIASRVGDSRHVPSVAAMSVAGERGRALAGQVDERLAAHVDDRLVDGAAGERPRPLARVVVAHRLGAVAADVQPLAGDRELARLRPYAGLADRLFAHVQRQRALGGHAV